MTRWICNLRVLCLLAAALGVALCACAPQKAQTAPEDKPSTHRPSGGDPALSKWKRNVRVFGELRDEQGTPLRDVYCTISRFIPGGFEGRQVSETKTFHESFEFKAEGVASVTFHFFKKDFHGERFELDLVRRDIPTTVSDGYGQLQRDVVLTKIDTALPDLVPWDSYLGVKRENEIRVMSLKDIRAMTRKALVTFVDCRLKFTSPTANLTYPIRGLFEELGYPCMIADMVSSPGVARAFSRPTIPVSPADAVAQLSIVNGGSTDGLCLFVPEKTPEWDVYPPEMGIAPEAGYAPALDIPAEAFIYKTTDRIFFWIRCDGIYGKGYVHRWNYQNDRLSCLVRVLFQPDGSRNVKTRTKVW